MFDLDGTLVDERPGADAAFTAAANHAARRTGVDADAFVTAARAAARQVWWEPDWLGPLTETFGLSAWDALSEAYEGCVPEIQPIRDWLPEYRRAVWTATLDRVAVTDPRLTADLADELADVFIRARHAHVTRPLPGALELLDALADRTLVVLTNGPADGQRRKLTRSGIADRVHALVISTEAGAGKPDPTAMRIALAEVESAPTNAIMVGDTYERDVLAAINAGMPAIWITGTQQPPQTERADVQVVAATADVGAALLRMEEAAAPPPVREADHRRRVPANARVVSGQPPRSPASAPE
ncbi:MAG TPA: HAD family hydrolase [Pilimelia sp.]|nr:HAD family hydrolase [Pilimelia sp.]